MFYTGLALQVPSTIVAGAAMMLPEGGCLPPEGSASHSCRRLAAAGSLLLPRQLPLHQLAHT